MIRAVATLLYAAVFLLGVGDAADAPKQQADELSPPLVVGAEVAQRSGAGRPSLFVVTLFNKSAREPVTEVNLSLGAQGAGAAEQPLGDLAPGQSLAYSSEVGAAAEGPFVRVRYKWRDREHSVARALIRPPVEKGESALPFVLPILTAMLAAAFGIGGTLLGARITNSYAEKREAARSSYEWSKMLFEKYEAAYRDFLYNWGGSTDPDFLRTNFNQLRRDSLVPQSIADAYAAAAAAFSGDQPKGEREQAGVLLRRAVEDFMKRPWYGDPQQ